MLKYAIGLSYRGGDLNGWQKQKNVTQTAQGLLDAALTRITAQPVFSYGGARTDAGVHAINQVAHFETIVDRGSYQWLCGINRYLPRGFSGRWIRKTTDDFHARWSAIARSYAYVLYSSPHSPGWSEGMCHWYYYNLNEDAMREAAHYIIGEHDFSSFRAASCDSASAYRRVEEVRIERKGNYVIVHIRANAFLRNMVRILISCLVEIGRGAHEPQWLEEVLAQRDRTKAAATVSAQGLYLKTIEYPAKFQLPTAGPEWI